MPYKDLEQRKAYDRRWHQQRHLVNRAKVLAFFGSRCLRCGIDDERVLQLDHIKPIRRKVWGISSGTPLIRDILNGRVDPKTLQLLCANCHIIKTIEDSIIDR